MPTLDDSGYILWESRVIMTYLVEKYGKPDCPLFPKDLQKRAIINRLLYFDMLPLYYSVSQWLVSPCVRAGEEKGEGREGGGDAKGPFILLCICKILCKCCDEAFTNTKLFDSFWKRAFILFGSAAVCLSVIPKEIVVFTKKMKVEKFLLFLFYKYKKPVEKGKE